MSASICGCKQRMLRLAVCCAALAFFIPLAVHAAIVYQTGFEASEGYRTNLDLVGQKGWTGETAGGNGLLSGWWAGRGQQAYVGFSPPTNSDSAVFVYQPLNQTVSQVQCSVSMAIEDSHNTNWDDFYWSVYNQDGKELFTLDFDNYELKLYYHLGGWVATNRVYSGLTYSNGTIYQLKATLDFAANRWSATFGGQSVATNKPLTTVGAALNFGDFDAAWVMFDPSKPGDNFMVFDDYQISTSAPVQPSSQWTVLGVLNGAPTLRLTSIPDGAYAIEISTDLVHWSAVKTNTTSGGTFDFLDSTAASSSRRFYRARWVP